MNKRNNLLITARIKPIEYDSKMLKVEDKKLTIRDLYNKSNFEEQYFEFDKFFNINNKNNDIFNYFYSNCLNKILDNLNCFIFSLGITGSGKHYTLFGDDLITHKINNNQETENGLIKDCVNFLLDKKNDFLDSREVDISISVNEISFDGIYDLGISNAKLEKKRKIFSSTKKSYEENSFMNFIRINLNDDKMDDSIEFTNISKIKDYELFINNYIKNKDHFNVCTQKMNLNNVDEVRGHTIVIIKFKMKDNNIKLFPEINSNIFFVCLGGIEKTNVLKNEGSRAFQDSIMVNRDYDIIQKSINNLLTGNKNNFEGSNWGYFLKNNLNEKSLNFLLGHINPNEANFEESLNTLTFMEKCYYLDSININKKLENKENKIKTKVNNYIDNEKLLIKLQKEKEDLQLKLDFMNKDFKKKISDLSNLLEVTPDLLIKYIKDFNCQFWKDIKDQSEVTVKYNIILKINQEIELEISQYNLELKNLKNNYLKRKKNYNEELKNLNNKIKDLKENLSQIKKNNDDRKKLFSNNLSMEVKKLIISNTNIMRDMINPIISASNTIDNKTQENFLKKDVIRKKENNLNYKYNEQIQKQNKIFTEKMNSILEKFNWRLDEKEKGIKEFIEEFNQIKNIKKNENNIYKNELLNLYEEFLKLHILLNNLYNKKRYINNNIFKNLKKFEKPVNRKFPILFKEINKKKYKEVKLNKMIINNNNLFNTNFEPTNISEKNNSSNIYSDKEMIDLIIDFQKEIKLKEKQKKNLISKIAKFSSLKEKYSINDFNNLKTECSDLRKKYIKLMINNQQNKNEIEKNILKLKK